MIDDDIMDIYGLEVGRSPIPIWHDTFALLLLHFHFTLLPLHFTAISHLCMWSSDPHLGDLVDDSDLDFQTGLSSGKKWRSQ